MALTQGEKIAKLFNEAARSGMSRRELMKRGTAMGISASALSVAFVQQSHHAMAQGVENPLGVDPNAPLDVVIFKGGYSDEYALDNNERYKGLYPGAEITYAGTQRLQEQYQARFVDGNPPDVLDNSGAGNLPNATLVAEGQLADLADLLDAEAYGQPGVKFIDSLLPGTQADGVYNGVQHVLNYVISVNSIWYNQALFDEHGWTYPQTWDEMIALGHEIQDTTGVAAWTYQGQYPQYMRTPWAQMVWKTGGIEAIQKIDNLAEDAWTQDVVQESLNAFARLYEEGLILSGTEALSHTESQSEWLLGKAAFLPCGTWLAKEMEALLDTLPDFRPTINAVPSLTDSDVIPFAGIQSAAGETFIVPSQGNNVQGGKEYLRLLFSKEASEFFASNVYSPTVVAGVGEGIDLGAAFSSAQAADIAAGEHKFTGMRFAGWYPDLGNESRDQFGFLLTGQTSVSDMVEYLQDLTNEIREDDSVVKYTREN